MSPNVSSLLANRMKSGADARFHQPWNDACCRRRQAGIPERGYAGPSALHPSARRQCESAAPTPAPRSDPCCRSTLNQLPDRMPSQAAHCPRDCYNRITNRLIGSLIDDARPSIPAATRTYWVRREYDYQHHQQRHCDDRTKPNRQVCLADPWWPLDHDMLAVLDEVAAGELLDLLSCRARAREACDVAHRRPVTP